jgi:hypothetical protein
MLSKKKQLKYAKEEAQEHGVSMRLGYKLMLDHVHKFGDSYYPAVERLEKRLTKKK